MAPGRRVTPSCFVTASRRSLHRLQVIGVRRPVVACRPSTRRCSPRPTAAAGSTPARVNFCAISREPTIVPSARRIRLPSAWDANAARPIAPQHDVVGAADQDHRHDGEQDALLEFREHGGSRPLAKRQVLGDRAEHGDRHEHQQAEDDDDGPQRESERRAVGAKRPGGLRRRRLGRQRARPAPAAR